MVVMREVTRKLLTAEAGLVAAYSIMKAVAKKRAETADIDKDNPYIKLGVNPDDFENKKAGIYEGKVKPALDHMLSFSGLVVLSPLFGLISLAVYLDDPGPIFFVQKRVGRNGRYFYLHKYRSMKMSTPHDVPTHELKGPEQYITRVGRVLRASSLDELPQIWDIFRGKMSVIGPRPALWNQENLVNLRSGSDSNSIDANSVMPGLTGLAQIKGRDELELEIKAGYDKEYARVLENGGLKAFFQDCRLLLGTIASVACHDGVVEGGTGSLSGQSNDFQTHISHKMQSVDSSDVGFEDYGFKKSFSIDKNRKVKVLITGAGSYIGERFKAYCNIHYPGIECETLNMKDDGWREFDFRAFDTVFHVAGIAHADVEHVTLEQQMLYYNVNSDLAVETAKVAKAAGIHQFIYMSSMIIYGVQGYIDEHTVPAPINFYGDSKWQGDKGVRAVADEKMAVAVLRSPMIYGKGSKGNFSMLSKIARKAFIFPRVENKRSMLYIDNLCEFVAQLTLSGSGGIYFPQNRSYSNTSSLMRSIAEVHGRHLWQSKVFTPAIGLARAVPIGKVKGLANKAFGNSYYDQRLSAYDGLDYTKISLEESIWLTEA